jgi:hypothetical protein
VGLTAKNYHYENEAGQRIHKKQVWDRAKVAGVSEIEQSVTENLAVVEEMEKLKFFYAFRR